MNDKRTLEDILAHLDELENTLRECLEIQRKLEENQRKLEEKGNEEE